MARVMREVQLPPVTVLPYVLFRYETNDLGEPYALQVIGFYGGYFEALDNLAKIAESDYDHGYDVLNLTNVVGGAPAKTEP